MSGDTRGETTTTPRAARQLDVEPLVTVEGTVERIVYESADSGFLVARLQPASQPGTLTTFVGQMISVSPGEYVRLRGRWVDDKRFGRQLQVESCETLVPESVDGIERYLGSGLIPGIGPVNAKRIVAAFGRDTLRVIGDEPHRLHTIPGIGRKRAKQIREGWAAHRAVQAIHVFLQGHGVGAAQAVKIYKAYGDRALAVLRDNPYRLAQDIAGIGFQRADEIAKQIGFANESPVRLSACVVHGLEGARDDGHCFLTRDDLLDRAATVSGVAQDRLADAIVDAEGRERILADGHAYFLPLLLRAEKAAAERLAMLRRTPATPVSIDVDKALQWVQVQHAIKLSPEQQEAIRYGIESKVMVLTGGPGTGKTTVLRSLLAILQRKGLGFLLGAPTGRAAKRLAEAAGHDAATLHRMLEFSPKLGGFARNEADPLLTDLLVIDEGSMLDIELFAAVLRALPDDARLLLVGDIDQLPSVGPGNVLFDCIASESVRVVRLQTVFRQASESGIVANAHRINRGMQPEFNETDFVFLARDEADAALDTIVELVARRIPDRFALDAKRDVQVLAPMRRGDGGTNRINERLQEVLNAGGTPVPRRPFRLGDKVIQTRNDYDLDVYNGDIGFVYAVEGDQGGCVVEFDGRFVTYAPEASDQLQLAYAMTIHKSQGSEYPAVVMPFLPQHFMMLQRNVLYTGLTRARRLVVVVGNRKSIAAAVRTTNAVRRNTRLAERLRGESPPA